MSNAQAKGTELPLTKLAAQKPFRTFCRPLLSEVQRNSRLPGWRVSVQCVTLLRWWPVIFHFREYCSKSGDFPLRQILTIDFRFGFKQQLLKSCPPVQYALFVRQAVTEQLHINIYLSGGVLAKHLKRCNVLNSFTVVLAAEVRYTSHLGMGCISSTGLNRVNPQWRKIATV